MADSKRPEAESDAPQSKGFFSTFLSFISGAGQAQSTGNPELTRETLSTLSASHNAMHGRNGDRSWSAPILAVQCDEDARPGYATCKANEYQDTPDVLAEKIRLLADLIRQSHNCVAYTGAGISTSSGIDDYATKAGRKSLAVQGAATTPKSPLDAQPTFAHRTLAAMYRAGSLKYWVQQNHDGLPQKAGIPQHAINEIHGAWFDPSNPVVPMSGELRGDLYQDMLLWEQKADLVLVLGTSMCGMNADRVAITCAQSGRLGMVIVNLQCTQYDNLSSLRIFAKIDDVMRMLVEELSLHLLKPNSFQYQDDVFLVPYGRDGQKAAELMPLDLSYGSKIVITMGPHKDSYGLITGKSAAGHFKVTILVHNAQHDTYLPIVRMLGGWWPQEAVDGIAPYLPLVNVTHVDGLPDKLHQLAADLA